MRKILLIAFLFVCCFCSIEAEERLKWSQLTFEYSPEELDTLKQLPKPQRRIALQELYQLMQETSYLINTVQLAGIDKILIPAYLANVQKDFAWLSYLLTGELTGSLDTATLWTLQLFIPGAKLPNFYENGFDVYTGSLAALVVGKAAERLHAEKQKIADYPIKTGKSTWKPTAPGYIGLDFGSLQTWFLDSSDQYVADSPLANPDFWKEQCKKIKEAQKDLDSQKRQAVFEWAGLTSIGAGSWEKILDNYLKEKQVPIIPQLYIRSVFLSALTDATASSFNSKYLYWIMRPSQIDREVKLLVVIPNHPSYPSAHSTVAATAASILSEFFPQEAAKWDQLAEEAGMSRIWGGLHYPIDHTAGVKLGNEVGQTVLKKMQR